MSDLDIDRPNTYRLYDYLLGGSFNFAADRAFARDLLETVPWAHDVVRLNRGFLTRAVRHSVRRGVRQFLDLGSGIQTVSRMDQIARAVDARCRVVYVDSDPMAIAHSDVLLEREPNAVAVRSDIRDVTGVLGHPLTTGLLDLDQPVGLLMGAVVHFLGEDDDPAGVVAAYQDALVPGSTLAMSHATYDDVPSEIAKVAPLFRGENQTVTDRSRAEVAALFGDWHIVEPGVVFTGEWRPELPLGACDRNTCAAGDPGRAVFLAGVATKP